MCVFCRIIAGEIPSQKVYEDEFVLAIQDIQPQAPVHIIFMPKTHVLTCADDVTGENSQLVARIFEAIPKVAAQLGLKDGYRIINNCGKTAGQTVPHLHFHLLAGKEMGETLV